MGNNLTFELQGKNRMLHSIAFWRVDLLHGINWLYLFKEWLALKEREIFEFQGKDPGMCLLSLIHCLNQNILFHYKLQGHSAIQKGGKNSFAYMAYGMMESESLFKEFN